ncbi:hypothetical protein E8E11_007336 [Didymella keratinophila]|nr:hypothetical protein E8E11_007336 [Didymella keratinophila]
MPAPRAPLTPITPLTPSMQMMTPVPGLPGPQGPPGASDDSGESLEQRMYDLLAPLREAEQDDKGDCTFHLAKTKNIAFLVRHHYSVYGKRIDPNDISLVTKNWAIGKEENTKVDIAVFVIANGFSNTVLRTIVENNNNAIDKLSKEIDKKLQQLFPSI